MAEKTPKEEPLVRGLRMAMQALDRQVARAMQRDPAERDVHGVQKWEPLQERIERVSSFLLNSLGEQEIQLDSLLVLA
ncbi:MAG: hypothetical protein KDD44_07285, partial [Bdellovibrionales bacterium]|nr:hypothetical protein [Bdellovibrionales bacterium]